MKKTGMKKNKKGLSPIIATVLLIVLVIIIALIIFLWAKRFIGEAIQKQGASVEQKCGEVNLVASRTGTTLYLDNKGNIPIYSIEVKIKSSGRETIVRRDLINLVQGQSGDYDVPEMDGAESVVVVPSLLGETKTSKKEYTCTNNEFEALEE